MIRTTFAHVFHSVSIVGVVLLFVPVSQADIIHVPGDQPTIQAGIDAAIDGDEVVLADGTYTGAGNRNLDFGGKAITVRSASGDPELCVIDVEQAGRGFYFHSGEVDDSVVSGITITNGAVTSSSPEGGNGGAVCCMSTRPMLLNCRIVSNSASAQGGGIYLSHSSSQFIDCIMENNSSWNGGGVCSDSSRPTLTGCTFSCNTSEGGGGMYVYGFYATLVNCDFNDNTANQFGGGMLNSNADPKLTSCSFNDNTSQSGGGMHNYHSSPTLKSCTFIDNFASENGGGMNNVQSDTRLLYCRFSDNSAGEYVEGEANSCGGGMYNISSDPTLIGCSFFINAVFGSGGGMYNTNSTSVLVNCLFVGNAAWEVSGCLYNNHSSPVLRNCTLVQSEADFAIYNHDRSNPSIKNCIIWGSFFADMRCDQSSHPVVTYSAVRSGPSTSWFGEGCLNVYPEFVDWDGPDDLEYTFEDNDFRLAAGSPCIDAGDNTVVAVDTLDLDGDGNVDEPTPFDFVGNHRFADDPNTVDTGNGTAPLVDMGIYEFQMLGDLDWDGDVDLDDFGLFFACLVEPGVMEPPAGVDPLVFGLADLDEDGDVDLKDFRMFQMLYGQ